MERDRSSCLLPVAILLLLVLLALTGFVCTHKIQAEEECLSTNILCYECDSRYDPNCADPFDFSPNATLESPTTTRTTTTTTSLLNKQQTTNETEAIAAAAADNHQVEHQTHARPTNSSDTTNSTIPALPPRRPKKLPPVAVCQGCCVKITSRLPDGVVYVKRTCTTNIQINYFMVGLVCMKESGDKGKMCFCENDYCNGQASIHNHSLGSQLLPITILITTFSIARIIFKFPFYQISILTT